MPPPATKGSVFTAGALSTASSLAFTAKASILTGNCPYGIRKPALPVAVFQLAEQEPPPGYRTNDSDRVIEGERIEARVGAPLQAL